MMFVVAALLALPRFAPMLANRLPVTGNLQGVHLPADLPDNALRSLLAWFGQPDVSPFWLSDAPLLPVKVLLPFVAGVATSFRRWRDPRYAVLLLALPLTTFFGGVIWTASPLYVRYLTALPAIVLFVAVGAKQVTDVITSIKPGGKWLGTAVVLAMVAQCVLLSLQHPAQANVRIPAGLWEQDRLARVAANLPAGETAEFAVTSAFGGVDAITLADYVTALGQRRGVHVIPQH
ncbi:MAG: hypothetical protein R3E39_11770 [Anaerolineae bacterium]